jgi:hypothetical protein
MTQPEQNVAAKNSSAIGRLKLGASVNWLVTILSGAGVVLAFAQAHDVKISAAAAQTMHDQDRDAQLKDIGHIKYLGH